MHDLADTATVSNITYRAKAGKVVQKDVDTANALVQLSVDFEKSTTTSLSGFGGIRIGLKHQEENIQRRRKST